MARILAIDYGKKRSGVAVTDPLQIIAGGLKTVDTSHLLTWILQYVQQEEVECIVFGDPYQPSGKPSENNQRVHQFVLQLQKALPQVRIDFYDERFTSVLAHQTMLASGLRKKARQDKALVDEISATIILQGYLEHSKHSMNP